jgi:quercetin dioxygenase-like cupin family protein
MIHEDERRILESWAEAKIITAKQDCILGNHYHKIKTEKFIVSDGYVVLHIEGKVPEIMEVGKIYTVNPNENHSFNMEQGSVMIGLCSHPFDHTDDFRK